MYLLFFTEGFEAGVPPTRRPLLDARFWQDLARKHHQTELKTKMKEDRVQKESQVGTKTFTNNLSEIKP